MMTYRLAAHHPRRGWTLALTSIGFFMVALDALVVVTALPAIQRDLHSGISTLEWTVNAYSLAFAAGIIPAAALGDRLGRRRVFALGLALFSAASAACALAPSTESLVGARIVQGLGAAAVMPLSLTILAGAFSAERRGAIVGVWGGIAGLAIAGGPLVGGAVTEGIDWHWVFWINVPVGLAATLLSIAFLAETHGPPTRLDLPAIGLVAGGASSIVWGLARAGDVGWARPEVAAGLTLGALLLACFVARERRVPDPMLPVRLFTSRTFAAANAAGFLMTGSIFGAAFLVSQYFQFVLRYSPWATGLRLLPWTATPIVVAPVAGRLADRIGPRPVIVAGMLLQGVGLAWFALVATTGVSYGQLVLPLVVAGIGVSMAIPTTSAAVLSAVAPPDMGKASGTNSTIQRFGAVFGVAVATAVFAAAGHLGSVASFTAGFRPALALAACMSALGAITALSVDARRPALEQAEARAVAVAN